MSDEGDNFTEDDIGWDDDDDMAEAALDCGQTADGGCQLAGTEWCDWSCPFSDELYRRARRNKRQGKLDV